MAEDALGKPITLDIPEHTRLEDALIEWGTKAGMTVMINTPTVEHQITQGVRGTLRAGNALSELLRNTGLSYTAEDGRIRVVPATALMRSAQRDEPPQSASPSSSEIQGHHSSANDVPKLAETRVESTQKNSHSKEIEEIVVTAQKREERLIDVPISIVAMSAEELQQREITSIDDLGFAVPGLAIQGNGQSRSIEIRGIANAQNGTSPLVGVYLDEAGVSSSNGSQLDLNTYDLERVEVLRGPQGTLFGQGSVGGTIRFITRNPDLKSFSMNSDVAALFTQDGAPGQRVNVMLNVPVLEDELGFRVSGTFDHEGGWIDQPTANRKDINGKDLTDVRIKGLWTPVPRWTVSAMAEIHRNDTSPQMGEDANGNYTQQFNLTTTPSEIDNFDIYNLTLTHDFAPIRILNTTSYVNQDVKVKNQGYFAPLFGSPPTPPLEFYYPSPERHGGGDLNEELRLTPIDSGPWQWTIGGFYQRFRYHEDVTYVVGLPGPLPAAPLFSDKTTLSKSWAVFGDTSVKLIDRLTLGAGLRYFRDDQEFVSSSTRNTAMTQTGVFHALSPRAYARYELTDEVNVYASAAKGFRSGGFNGENQPSFDPESVWTYELGTKMSLAGGRLSADAAVFYSDYTNYQILGILPPPAPILNITRNAGSAWIKGIDWDLTWRPADNWTLSFNGEELNTRFYKINLVGSAYAVGDGLDFVPKNRFIVSARRDFNLNSRPGFVRLDYNEQGRETYRNRSFGPWFYGQTSDIHMLNFSTGLHWNSNLRLGFFAQNLLNNRNFTDPYFIEGLAPRSRPRTYGIEFGVSFD